MGRGTRQSVNSPDTRLTEDSSMTKLSISPTFGVLSSVGEELIFTFCTYLSERSGKI